jgi:hypothetical protein
VTPAEILLTAADGIEAHDWCQGANFVDQAGKRWMLLILDEQPDIEPVAADAMGAICLVGQDDIEARNAAIVLLERHLAGGDRDVRPCVSKWNDDRRRTKAEVVDAMRRAAKAR